MKEYHYIDPELKSNTELFRYFNFESFISLVEGRQIILTNINVWDDKWEGILSKLPTVDDKGKETPPLYSFHQDILVQSWSLKEESDAMWRIYSPTKTGLRISTTVKRFNSIQGISRWHLGKVIYFQTLSEVIETIKPETSPFVEALYKRDVFEHEAEVRFLTHGQFLIDRDYEYGSSHVSFEINPTEFIESIAIDPRADEWFVETVQKYCERIGFPIHPVKSNLYEQDPQLKVGIVRTWVPVGKKKTA